MRLICVMRQSIRGERVRKLVGHKKLDALYSSLGPEAAQLALFLTGDPSLAEEIAQESFVRSAVRLQDLRSEGSFRAYLRRTVINMTKSHFRRQQTERRNLPRIESMARVAQASSGDFVSDYERQDVLKTALYLLPQRQREAVVLRYCMDLSVPEIADVLGASDKAVESLIQRGRVALRSHLGGSDVDY